MTFYVGLKGRCAGFGAYTKASGKNTATSMIICIDLGAKQKFFPFQPSLKIKWDKKIKGNNNFKPKDLNKNSYKHT